MNVVFLTGRLGKEVEFHAQQEYKYCKFSLAVSEFYKDRGGERKEKTTWLYCTAWNRVAEILRDYTKKGSKILVIGKIEITQDKTDDKKYYTNINVEKIELLERKEDTKQTKPKDKLPEPQEFEDDIPF